MIQFNAKTMNVLYCVLDTNDFNNILTYNSTKKNWDRLEITHEALIRLKSQKSTC